MPPATDSASSLYLQSPSRRSYKRRVTLAVPMQEVSPRVHVACEVPSSTQCAMWFEPSSSYIQSIVARAVSSNTQVVGTLVFSHQTQLPLMPVAYTGPSPREAAVVTFLKVPTVKE